MTRGIPRIEPYSCGTKASYEHKGCRCEQCRAAKAEAERMRRRRNAYGLNPWVDAEPVRRHVRSLMAPYQGSNDGIGYERIADLAGVKRCVVRALLYGINSRLLSRRIHKDNAEKLLVVRALDRLRAPGATVDARPAVGLAECIHRYGISKRRIGGALGTRYPGVRFGRTITVKRARDIAALHWKLFREEPEFRRGCECPLPHDVEAELIAS